MSAFVFTFKGKQRHGAAARQENGRETDTNWIRVK